MQAFNDYIRNIMYLVVFMTFVGMIMPGGNYRKYVDIVMGLVLIIVIITPIASLVGAEARAGEVVARFLDGDISAMTAHDEAHFMSRRERMLNENVNDIVAAQISALIRDTGFSLIRSDVRFSAETGEFLELRLIVSPNGTSSVAGAVETVERRPFIRIERVEVSLRESRQTGQTQNESTESIDAETQLLRKIISDFYNVSQDNIHIEEIRIPD
ncbi:MAG: stage III sporulation protein AF [Defluviitaleaceae bacterium]|nr:stage III sporulation protein AF [Defluviitaleaceae bacterium]